ncbi:MAG: NTP transferase domain-containing protein [Candidatus Krumholzibacteriota bacterium]|nr:NTP transferase domain-containing protein [Candidatus Krumholzibacteriota bacterium]
MNSKSGFSALILAAGEGTRMKSDLAKVLHKLRGIPMIRYVVNSVREINPDRIVLVVGYQSEAIIDEFKDENLEFVLQEERLGTGHAVMMARDNLEKGTGTIIVLTGDTPLLNSKTLREFIHFHGENNNSATVLSTVMENPEGYGRIIRDSSGGLDKIVEHRDASDKELKVNEVNSGIFCFQSSELFKALEKVNRKNSQAEYYLTDVMAVLNRDDRKTGVFRCKNRLEVIGINTSEQLEEAERLIVDG